MVARSLEREDRMETYQRISPEFEAVRDRDEEFLWVGKPSFWPFFLSDLPFTVFALGWFTVGFIFLSRLKPEDGHIPPGWAFLIISFFLMLSLFDAIRLLILYNRTAYAVTNKRVMTRSGFWGTGFNAIDYDQISDTEVTVGFLDSLFGVGTIRCANVSEPRPNPNGFYVSTVDAGNLFFSPSGTRLHYISNPYAVFKLIKGTTVDVKTDWNYPNAYRPEENPGYQTKYRPR